MRKTLRALALLPLLALLAACTPVLALTPADDAKNAQCAEVIVRLPEEVAGQNARETDAQATGAWGEPATVVLRCGVPVPAPTSELACRTVGGVDWLIDDSEDPIVFATTYGRDPAIQVKIAGDLVQGGVVLDDLGSAVSIIPADRACLSLEDVQ